MAFVSGPVTFRRYRVLRSDHKTIDDAMLSALAANAFGRYGAGADADVETGWVTTRHVFDVDFAADKIAAGRFAYFAMRMDRNSVPASILRSYVAIEEETALEVSGRDFLDKRERRDAKEAAKLRAEKEARSGAFRRITTVPVLFDVERSMLYFGSTGVAANDRLQRLFADTFDTVLEPMNAHAVAVDLADRVNQKRAIEDAKPAHLVQPPDDLAEGSLELDTEDRGFLGREMLSWLWHTVECAEGVFELLDKSDVAASIVKTIQLKCDFNLTGSATVRDDAPGSMAEARAAIAGGKQPVRMGLLLAARAGEWSLVLDGVNLDVSGLALPSSDERDPAAVLESRFEAVADLAGVIDALFEMFLRKRLAGEWKSTHEAMMRWAAGEGKERGGARPRLVSA